MAGERTCIVCEGHGPFMPMYARDGFTPVRCPGCGLVFQDPQPTDADLETTYYHGEEWTRMVLGPLREKLLERARKQLGFLNDAGVTPAGGVLLDVGCSSGTFMELAAQTGWNTVGVELGETTAQAARDRGLDVRTGTLAAVADQFVAGSFSLVTFWDVPVHRGEATRAGPVSTVQRFMAATGGRITALAAQLLGDRLPPLLLRAAMVSAAYR